MSSARKWASLAVLVGAVLLLTIDSTVLYLAVPHLTQELGATSAQILWIGDIYSLAIAGLLVTMGNLADLIGRKRLLLMGAVAFAAASALAAFSVTPEMLIVARLLLGIAGATLMPSTLALIRTVFEDPAERSRAIAIWSAAAAGGLALGPLVGGALLAHFWWGSVFLINVPVVAILVVAGAIVLPESKNPDRGRFDLLSSALSMAALVPLVFAIKKSLSGDLGLAVVVALAISVVASVAFVRRQRRSPAPMIDVSLFRVPEFAGAVSLNFITVFAFSGLLFFFSQYLQLVQGMTPLEAGLAQLPVSIASMAVVALVGWSLRRLGRGPAIGTALLVAAAGLVGLGLAESGDSYLWIGLALVPVGLGIGLAETLSVDAVVSAVPAPKAGAAASVSETAYELGVAFGIAVLGSVVSAVYRAHMVVPAYLTGSDKAAAADSLSGAAHVLDPASEAWRHAQEAFVAGMQVATIVAVMMLLGGAVVAWRIIPGRQRRDLTQEDAWDASRDALQVTPSA